MHLRQALGVGMLLLIVNALPRPAFAFGESANRRLRKR